MKNGERIAKIALKSYGAQKATVGIALVLETVFLPVWAVPLLFIIK